MAYNLNATDMVYDFIVDKIRSNEWPPGSRIWSETELCRVTGVSRTAVRQAVEKLAALSVLSKVHGSGTYVMSVETSSLSGMPFFQLSRDDVISLLEFRRFFEMGNVEMFIDNADENDIRRLEENYREMCANTENKDKFYYLDNEFHIIIAQGSKNPYVLKVADSFFEALESAQWMLNVNLGPQRGVEYHGYILDLIKKGDRELAPIYMKRHMEENIRAIKEKLAQG